MSSQSVFGAVVLVAGFLSLIVGVIIGQSGVYVPDNILGLYSPVTAICVFGGLAVAFCGFALMMVGANPNYKKP